ncbi:zinc finger A20 and AN1 domain-containing stress-associated protein 8-like [Argentina anserina]|uniref:zinc finger A20 and AN1 domain-containing stress-associated protein 8-like n=1 Tax=Argentina anserina TaxID=57926 RepID=UPI0021767519|nr:zinc finger A20 and AN1 domain-containing stress-associated protein 8-like [Potentilla anserina]
MDHEETGCQAAPEGPILCVNNCGFFGSAATMNMCSKCHKDLMMKQEQAKLAASSIGSFVNGTSSSHGKEPVTANPVDSKTIFIPTLKFRSENDSPSPFSFGPSESAVAKPSPESFTFGSGQSSEPKPEGPKRCTSCNKRVGLTGFNCRCGDLFCAVHRYSDKHDCPYDYRTAGRDAIAKANPVVKAEKLDKI